MFGGEVIFKRKYRFVFYAINETGEVVFPEAFIKVDGRPAYPKVAVASENGGEIVDIPGTFLITQFFTFYDNDDEALKECQKYIRGEESKTGRLVLYDGCGVEMERWEFQGLKLKKMEDQEPDYGFGDIIIQWQVDYEKANYSAKGIN
jgi:hypothetical protein